MTADRTRVVVCGVCGKKNRVPDVASGTPRCGHCSAPLPWIVEAGGPEIAEVVEASDLPVVLDLWAPWCGPCRMVTPSLERLAQDHAGAVKLVKVNVDEAPDVSQRFAVQGIPTLVLLDHGSEVARQIGAAPERELRRWLEEALAQLPEADRPSAPS